MLLHDFLSSSGFHCVREPSCISDLKALHLNNYIPSGFRIVGNTAFNRKAWQQDLQGQRGTGMLVLNRLRCFQSIDDHPPSVQAMWVVENASRTPLPLESGPPGMGDRYFFEALLATAPLCNCNYIQLDGRSHK